MKKIFVLMLVLFVAFSMFAVDEGVAGATKYKVSFGNGLNYNNKAGYDQVNNTFKFQVVLPVSTIVQVGVEGKFESYLDSANNTLDLNSWAAINNYGKIAVGIVPNDKLKVGFYVMGGSEGVSYKEQHKRPTTEKAMIGNGFVEFSAKLFLQSALFNNKISSLNIKQGAKIGFLGHGGGAIATGGIGTTLWSGQDGVFNFSSWKYFGEVAVEVPIHTLAGWTNITNFTYGATLAYNVSGVNYSTYTVTGGFEVYDVLPAKIAGELSLENWLKIAPDSSTEFKLTVKPGFTTEQLTSTMKGATVRDTWENTTFYTTFGLWGKKSFDISNALGIVPYFELDASWKLEYSQRLYSDGITNNAGVYDFNTGRFSVDPGVKLGLKFGNWETAIRWNPNATWALNDGVAKTAAADTASSSNIWNLANWAFSVACEFPPPTK